MMSDVKDLLKAIITGKDYNEIFSQVMADKAMNLINQHRQEVASTLLKPVEESESLEELNKSTLGSYIKKASHDVATKGALTRHYGEKSERERKEGDYVNARKSSEKADKIFAKSWKRREGMAKAVDRLTKEDDKKS